MIIEIDGESFKPVPDPHPGLCIGCYFNLKHCQTLSLPACSPAKNNGNGIIFVKVKNDE
jgi:hypothetical protein